MMEFRLLNKWYADLLGYFWLPCDNCGQMFGGHEASFGKTVLKEGRTYGVCPDCNANPNFIGYIPTYPPTRGGREGVRMDKSEWKVNHNDGVIQVGTTERPDIAWVTDEVNAKFIAQACNNWNSTAKLRGDVEVLMGALEKIRNITACDDPCGEFDSKRVVVWHLANQTIARIKGEK